MVAIDVDMLQNNKELNLEINSCIKNTSSKKKSSSQFEFCDTVSLQSGDLQRHVAKKYPSSNAHGPLFLDCFCITFSSHSRNETGTFN